MRSFDFNKNYAALKSKLRNILCTHEAIYAFRMSKIYLQSLQKALDELQSQEEKFAEFVIQKQKEIDLMDTDTFKEKMQKLLDKITVDTYNHFNKLTDKYRWMLKDSNDAIN